jgi:endonuclease YncB( thermonuclease family)
MKTPRRIFRRSNMARPGRMVRLLLGWTAGAVIVSSLVTIGLSSDLLGRASGQAEHLRAEPNQVAVVGGDTLRLGDRVVRLAGIEAPDRGDTCRGNMDCGGAATTVLAGMVRDRRVDCRLSGHDSMGRPFAACAANGVDLSSAVVESGWARAQQDEPALAHLELRARRRGAGLWADAHAH